jgi:tetratricopeptide (TPR) repeat protein
MILLKNSEVLNFNKIDYFWNIIYNEMIMKRILSLLFIVLISSTVFSQMRMKTKKWRKTESDSLAKGKALFENKKFESALPVFYNLKENHPNELYLKYMTGICGLYRGDMHGIAMDCLKEVYEKNRKAVDIEFYLARAYHYNNRFDEALELLNKYLKKKKLTDQQKINGQQLIDFCNHGKTLVATPIDAIITNIGAPINTVNSEYVPVLSSDESVMIYTYRGEESVGGLRNEFGENDQYGFYYEDIFITHKENGKWVKPVSIGTNINSSAPEAAIAISNDGQKLFIYKDDGKNGGGIFMSNLVNKTWSTPEELKGDVNLPGSWEGSIAFSADESTIYFSSDRPGGLGGKDLYKATLQDDGSWGHVENLGDKINTPLDDDAPFIHSDGTTLVYSSKGFNSMGGFDIYVSRYSEGNNSWSAPENIGYPINTTDDDIYFTISTDGKRGYYSSGKSGGYGLLDIYEIEMSDKFKKPVVAMVKGITTLDDNFQGAEIQVLIEGSDKKYGNYKSNSAYGNYLVNVVPGKKYKFIYKLKGHPDQTQIVDATNMTSYQEKNIDINFGVTHKTNLAKTDSLGKNNLSDSAKAVAKGTSFSKAIGNLTKEGLEYRVQIAAFKLPENYNFKRLKGLGKVDKIELEDGITRFTIGGAYKTLNEALNQKKMVRDAGQADAFVTIIYKGKRMYVADLEKMGLFTIE